MFTRRASLMNHKNKNICDKYNNLPYKCNHCNKRYAFKKSLLLHKKQKHSSNTNCNEIKCLLCNKKFTRQGSVRRHLSKGQCPMIKSNGHKISVINNNSINNDNSININNNNNNINININFGKEKLDDWIDKVGKKIIDKCIRNFQGLPCNLLEAKHVLAKQNRNIYLSSEEDKYNDMNIYSDGWKKMNTSLVLSKMLAGAADDIYDIIQNNKKYKLRLSKKLKEELDKKITIIQQDPYLKGSVVNMLLKNKDILSKHFNETNEIHEEI
jgi:hypothetical protein